MVNENHYLSIIQKNSMNDKDWNVFPKIYSNIKNLTMNVGFNLLNLFLLHEVVCSPLTLCLLVCVFLNSWFLNT